ncbi:MAG: dienelactone hydrolase family protein [Polaromonas sp.]|nr:dienelactone hydrolase family protein [Polaromonas sp.]
MRFTVFVALVLVLLGNGAAAQTGDNLGDGRGGDIEFTSFWPRGHHELGQATFDRKPLPVRGQLSLPPGAGKVPAVVIGHTVGGVQPYLFHRWAKALNEAGFAALVVDSFGPRGMGSMVASTALEINGAYLIADAFSALRVLATHPRIDAGRIAFIGFSMGGGTAPYLIQERFRRAVLGDSPLRFAAAVGHYPHCHYNFIENQPSPIPLFLFLAEKDDWTPAQQCMQYGKLLAERGYKVSVKVYEGANHGYDEDRSSIAIPSANSMGNCDPLLINLDALPFAPQYLRTGAPVVPGGDMRATVTGVQNWARSCNRRGATSGVSAGGGDRRADAVRDTITALQKSFSP